MLPSLFLAQSASLPTGSFAIIASSAAALYVALRFASRGTFSIQPGKLWLSTWPMASVAVALTLVGREEAGIILCVGAAAAVLTLGLAVGPMVGLGKGLSSRRANLLLPVVIVAGMTLRLPTFDSASAIVHALLLLVIGVVATFAVKSDDASNQNQTAPAKGSFAGVTAILTTLLAVAFALAGLVTLDDFYNMPADAVMGAFILAPIAGMALVMDEMQRVPTVKNAQGLIVAPIAGLIVAPIVAPDATPILAKQPVSLRVDAAVYFALRVLGVVLPLILLLSAALENVRTSSAWPTFVTNWLGEESPLTSPASMPPAAIRFVPLIFAVAIVLIVWRWRGGAMGKTESLLLILGFMASLVWAVGN